MIVFPVSITSGIKINSLGNVIFLFELQIEVIKDQLVFVQICICHLANKPTNSYNLFVNKRSEQFHCHRIWWTDWRNSLNSSVNDGLFHGKYNSSINSYFYRDLRQHPVIITVYLKIILNNRYWDSLKILVVSIFYSIFM